MAPSELLEVNGRAVHVVTVRPWNDGKQDNEEITVQLPARLTQKDKVIAVNTLHREKEMCIEHIFCMHSM